MRAYGRSAACWRLSRSSISRPIREKNLPGSILTLITLCRRISKYNIVVQSSLLSSRLRSRSARVVLIAIALGYPAVRAFQSAPKAPAPPEVRYPAQDVGVDTLAKRAADQKQAASQ